MTRLAGIPLAMMAMIACGSDATVAYDPGHSRPPPVPAPDASPPTGRWEESFDHRGQLEALEGAALLDSNLGRLTLEIEPVPTLEARGRRVLGAADIGAGLVRGEDVVLSAGELIEAPDSLEIQAEGSAWIEGDLRAGPGGVVISAGRRIVVGGQIEALGPIELRIRDTDGEIIINGTLLSAATGPDTGPARVLVGGRGRLEVNGQLVTEQPAIADGREEPEIRAAMYGPVLLGEQSQISAGFGGRVDISTSDRIIVASRAQLVDAAEWTLGAREVEIGPSARFELGRLGVTAELRLEVGEDVELSGGGDELALLGGRLELGAASRVFGTAEGGTSLRLEAARRLEAGEGAFVEAVTASCDRRGQVIVRVGGPYVGLGRAYFRSAPTDSSCPDADPSGVLIEARSYEGVSPGLPDSAATFGAPRLDPDLRVTVPPTAARNAGRWTSKPFAGSLHPPRLTALDSAQPNATQVTVALGIADGPEGRGHDFVPHDPNDPSAWDDLAGAPWLVVRIDLEGRRYDAPTVDLVQLDLSGS